MGVPALVILCNAVVMGISADVGIDHVFWDVVEVFFFLFFLGELIVKLHIFDLWSLFCGKDKLWNYFDLFCLLTAAADIVLTWLQVFKIVDASLPGGVMLIKILRLARLGRLIRLLRFKLFNELKMMVQGVVSGVRVLLWAIVLLLFCVFLLAIVCRSMLEDQPEMSTIFRAMFSLFRCFTDGCVSYNGTPLQERLLQDYHFGVLWMFIYILVYLFVTIGIFNLIMAIFIDNVVTAHIQRKQKELGENAAIMEVRINEVIAKRLERCRERNRLQTETVCREKSSSVGGFFGGRYMSAEAKDYNLAARKSEAQASIGAAADGDDVTITKEVFSMWLKDPEMLVLLEEVEVETSTKYELFDALDVDSGGELTVDELVSGLMKLRGPVSKNDIVATRLKVGYLTELVEEMGRKLGVEYNGA